MKNTDTPSSSFSLSSSFFNSSESLIQTLLSIQASLADASASSAILEAEQKKMNQLFPTLSLPSQNYLLPSLGFANLLNLNLPSFSSSSSSSMSPEKEAGQNGMSQLNKNFPLS